MQWVFRSLSPGALLVVAGCMVGPDYTPPDLATPEAFQEAPETAEVDPAAELAAWWTRFGDPRLTEFVDRAARSNLDFRIAEARVREAQALRGVAAAQLWPQADAVGEARFGTATQASGGGGGPTGQRFLGALDALWEIDVFGGVRRSVEAAEADVQVSIEERRALLLALVGEVAATYVDLRGFQGRVETVQRNLAAQQETRDLTEARLRVGLASDLDVERARAAVAVTAAELPPLRTAVKATSHRLGVLLGQEPESLIGTLRDPGPIPKAPRNVVVGVPAELLRRRPDLRGAERELAAATARIGEATADLYPKFSLTGSVGFRSDDVQEFLQGDFAAIGPTMVWPIFAGGRIVSNIEVQDARQEQALARYQQALLRALEEVENSLVRYAEEQVRRRELSSAVAANREAAEMARLLHANGLIEFLDVLAAERAQLETETRLVESETAVSTSLVDLYVALGGGWERAEEIALQ